jgi:hypothetical protein
MFQEQPGVVALGLKLADLLVLFENLLAGQI